jgi:predicted permease
VPVFAHTIERIEHLPGVRSASATSFLPFSGPAATTQIAVEGEREGRPDGEASATVRTVMPRYFETIGIPIRRGREFTPADHTPQAPLRFVVNEAFVRRYLSHADPLRMRISTSMARTNPLGEIIGVVGDVKEGSLARAPTPTVYYDHARLPYGQMTLLVRTDGDPLSIVSAVRRIVHDLDPSLAVADMRTMREIVGQTYARERFSAVLMGGFSLFALLLAAVGVYGVLTYAVSQRTSEIGVRLALGAGRSQIVAMVLRDAARFVIPGLLVGLAAAFVMANVVASLLFETDARDPMAFAVAPAILLIVMVVAAYIPAHRAARLDPVKAVQAG